jgi:hypothetical protein
MSIRKEAVMDADVGVLGADVPRFRCMRAPATYARATDGPVRYVPISMDGKVMGYLWVAVDDDAADFLPRDDAGDDGLNADVVWVARLRASRKRRVSAVEAFDYWLANGATEGLTIGEAADAASLDDLHDLASGAARDDAVNG